MHIYRKTKPPVQKYADGWLNINRLFRSQIIFFIACIQIFCITNRTHRPDRHLERQKLRRVGVMAHASSTLASGHPPW